MTDGYKEYGIDYHFDGALWAVHIFARDLDEAKARLKAITESGRVFGEITDKIPLDEEQMGTE